MTEKPISDIKLEIRSKRVEIIKNYFEIIAICIGGLWALAIFSIKEAPGINKEFKITGDIQIDSLNSELISSNSKYKGKCNLNCRIDAKNIGNNNLYIDSIQTVIWELPMDSILFDSSYLYFNELLHQTKTEGKGFMHWDNALVSYYPPDAERGEDFDFIVPIDANKAIMIGYYIYGHAQMSFFRHKNFVNIGSVRKLECIPDKQKEKDK